MPKRSAASAAKRTRQQTAVTMHHAAARAALLGRGFETSGDDGDAEASIDGSTAAHTIAAEAVNEHDSFTSFVSGRMGSMLIASPSSLAAAAVTQTRLQRAAATPEGERAVGVCAGCATSDRLLQQDILATLLPDLSAPSHAFFLPSFLQRVKAIPQAACPPLLRERMRAQLRVRRQISVFAMRLHVEAFRTLTSTWPVKDTQRALDRMWGRKRLPQWISYARLHVHTHRQCAQ